MLAAACERELAASLQQTSPECSSPSSLTAQAELPSGSQALVVATVYDRAHCVPDAVRNFWGSTDVPVERFIGDLRISTRGQEVWVPLSSYLDLGDPEAVAIEDVAQRSFKVVVRGRGDSGYVAQLQVEGGNVVSRRLFNPAFEGEAGETTQYSYPPDW